jgi:hypothetical protein
MPSSLRLLACTTIFLSSFTKATNIDPNDHTAHGLTIFYRIKPGPAPVSNYSTGIFTKPPLNEYECGPDPFYPFTEPNFGCNNLVLANATPDEIFAYRQPNPACLSLGIAFEHFQWSTWTHACWEHPYPAIDTPSGHAEAAFQSTAIAFRDLVLYQHDMHILTLNKRIEDLRLPKEAESLIMRTERDKRLKEIDDFADSEIGKLPAHGGNHRNRWKEIEHQRGEKKETVNADAEKALAARQTQFWVDSFQHRLKVVEIDHLIGEYWERWMSGKTQGGWDWAGMGEPVPAWRPNFIVPLYR